MASASTSPAMPQEIVDAVRNGRAIQMSDDEIAAGLAKHPVYGSRVSGLLQRGATPKDILDTVAGTPAATHQGPPSWYDPKLSGPWTGRMGEDQSTAERIATAPLNYFKSGFEQAGKGMSEVAGSDPRTGSRGEQVAQGISDLVRGGGQVALPFAAPGAVSALRAAPVAATMQGVAAGAAGTGAGLGTEYGLKSIGVPKGYSELAGTAVGLGAGYGAARGVQAMTRTNPSVAMVHAQKPTMANEDYLDYLEPAMRDIKAAGPVRNNDELRASARRAMERAEAQRDLWDERAIANGLHPNGDSVVQATAASFAPEDYRANPDGIRAVLQDAQARYGGNHSIPEWRQMLATKNAELDAFFDKTEGKQIAQMIGGKTLPQVKAQRDAIANLYYAAVDPDNQGAREIGQRMRGIISLLERAGERRNAIQGEKPRTPAIGLARSVKGAMTLDPDAAQSGFSGLSDFSIREAFKGIGAPDAWPEPPHLMSQGQYSTNPYQSPRMLPQGQAPFTQGTVTINPSTMRSPVPAGRMIEAPIGPQIPQGNGPIITPAPADTSFVRSAPAMAAPPNPARALPPATTRFTGPVPDDASFVRGAAGMAEPPNPVRALPPATTRFAGPPDASGIHPTTGSPLRGPSLDERSPTPLTGEQLAVRLGKTIWDALKGK